MLEDSEASLEDSCVGYSSIELGRHLQQVYGRHRGEKTKRDQLVLILSKKCDKGENEKGKEKTMKESEKCEVEE
jgi:hypothetical protein